MLKDEIKLRLLNTNMFIDNKYLELYINLIVDNSDTPRLYGKTQRHHILQRKWYNKNKLKIDNSKSNLVNLYYKDHILAHYYLYNCTTSWLKKANSKTLVNMLNLKDNKIISDELFEQLDTLQADYELFIKDCRCQQLDRQLLYKYYIVEDHSRAETAEHFRVPISCVDRNLERYNLNSSKVKTQNRAKIDSELLVDLYLNKDYTISELADYFQASTGKVKYILRGLKIKKDMHKPCPKRQRIFCDKEELYRLFITENKSYKELASLFRVSLRTVKVYLKRYNIKKDISLRGLSISNGKRNKN